MLNKQSGNMYPFITHTWNSIRGECEHDCKYCYMKRWGKRHPLKLDRKSLNDNLGHRNNIFVGSSTDMFAQNVPDSWIHDVLFRCRQYDLNKYLFQTKNPTKMFRFEDYYPEESILAVTIESDRDYSGISKAPSIQERLKGINLIKNFGTFPIMISIEPIMDFDRDFIDTIKEIEPVMVSIGADSKGHNLFEPPKFKITELIKELNTFTNVVIKDNLKRLNS